MTQTGTTPIQPLSPASTGPEDGYTGLLSVLCVSENPLFRDRICRNLEREGNIFVEIAVTAEDALSLVSYLVFDVVVTDCIAWQGNENGFLKAMRQRGIRIPFIYFIRDAGNQAREEIARLGAARLVPWNGHPDTLQFENLLQCILDMTDSRSGKETR
ncbi:response regulator [Methanoregula sp. PtaB.Bin085]|uniref:response regulator n=1 Tax=Methanoregula sp. PtaB.Bin085 TaxID=1811680 RepID=UPI0009C8D2F5|nr:response regulator [Methanoregula sp. PtaB.Bin085]OPX64833.1 MAG: hypothetical protein A4E33_00571 [Methanoregula sp. PtaB.Bin085]